MTGLNGQGNGTRYIYPPYEASLFPRQSVQVQVPRVGPGRQQSANVLTVNGFQIRAPARHPYSQQISNTRHLLHGEPQSKTGASTATSVVTNGHYPEHAPASLAKQLQPVTYQHLLLSLADEYFSAAYDSLPEDTVFSREQNVGQHYKLIATGLACLDVALREWKLQPQMEAAARFRYASILYLETENYDEAEEVLSKGISLCDRHRLMDYKYNMQHLLSRVMFATNQKASLRFIDVVVKDVEAYQHYTWMYAFRFLRASLSFQMRNIQDNQAGTNHMRIVASQASNRGDNAISATASAIEALSYLHRSNGPENIEQAQRALAAARGTQLDPAAQGIPQLAAMTHFVDLCCSLQQSDPLQGLTKMQAMQSFLDSSLEHSNWADDGVFHIPISQDTASILQCGGSAGGVIRVNSAGHLTLAVVWMQKEEVYALGYLLSGAASFHRNAVDNERAERYLTEGIRLVEASRSLKPEAINTPASRQVWRHTLLCQLRIHLIFALCARTLWKSAREQLELLEKDMSKFTNNDSETVRLFVHYISGMIHQQVGNTEAALAKFQSLSFTLPTPTNTSANFEIQRDLSILAALNSLLILRSPSHPSHHLLAPLLVAVEPFALSNPSRNIQAAFQLVRATAYTPEATGIIKTKQYLQGAMQLAKQTANNQLICITLNFMSYKFFRGVVGEQAEKSARASLSMAKKGKDTLWISVADAGLAEALEVQGKAQEAEAARKEGRELAEMLPKVMQREIGLGANG